MTEIYTNIWIDITGVRLAPAHPKFSLTLIMQFLCFLVLQPAVAYSSTNLVLDKYAY